MEKVRSQNIDMLNGSLWNKILLVVVPIAASGILQQLFNSADMAIVGRFASSEALAAVGSTTTIVNLIINIFSGLAIGTNVVISQALGAGDTDRVRKAVHCAMLTALVSGFILLIIGQLVLLSLLKLLDTPADIIDMSELYMRIYFLGSPFLMLYNVAASIYRSKGKTRLPLICLTCSGVLNLLLNILFVVGFGMDVDGVAIATVISSATSAISLTAFLMHEKSELQLDLKQLRFDKSSLIDIVRIGTPAAIQGIVFSASNMMIQAPLNRLGTKVVAATTVSVNPDIYIFYLITAFDQTCVTFNGQNLGARKFKRCTATTYWCLLLGGVSIAVISFLFLICKDFFISIFTTDQEVIPYVVTRLELLLVFEVFNMWKEIFSGAMRGLGSSTLPAILYMGSICGVRLLWVYCVFPITKTYESLLWVYPVSWIITTIVIGIAYFIVRRKVYRKYA